MREEITQEELDEVLFKDVLEGFLKRTNILKEIEYVNYNGKEVHSTNGQFMYIMNSMARNAGSKVGYYFDIRTLKMKDVDMELLKCMCTKSRRGTTNQKTLDFIYKNFSKIIKMYY